MYSYQWLYLPFVYPLLTVKNIISDVSSSRVLDFKPFLISSQVNLIFVAKSNGRIRMNPMDTQELALYIGSKLCFIVLRLVWPIYVLGPGTALALFMVAEFLHGSWLSFSFQVRCCCPFASSLYLRFCLSSSQANHVTVSVQIFRELQARKLSWAELQCLTTLGTPETPSPPFNVFFSRG